MLPRRLPGFGFFRGALELAQSNPQRRVNRALVNGGQAGAGVLDVDDAQRPAHGRTQGFAAAQVAHGAHRLGGVLVARQQRGNLGFEGLLPQRFEVVDLVQPGDGGGGVLQQVGHEARAGEQLTQALGGGGRVAEHAQVPAGTAERLGDDAESEQAGVRIHTAGKPAQQHGHEMPLNICAAGKPRGEGLDVAHGPARVAVTEGGQTVLCRLLAEDHLVAAERGDGGEQRAEEDSLVQ